MSKVNDMLYAIEKMSKENKEDNIKRCRNIASCKLLDLIYDITQTHAPDLTMKNVEDIENNVATLAKWSDVYLVRNIRKEYMSIFRECNDWSDCCAYYKQLHKNIGYDICMRLGEINPNVESKWVSDINKAIQLEHPIDKAAGVLKAFIQYMPFVKYPDVVAIIAVNKILVQAGIGFIRVEKTDMYDLKKDFDKVDFVDYIISRMKRV